MGRTDPPRRRGSRRPRRPEGRRRGGVRRRASGAGRDPYRRPTGWRRWAFPLAVALLPSLLLAAGLEVGLRLAGFGFDPAFFRPLPGGTAETTNPRFGWRFFPPVMARTPVVSRLARSPGDGVVRIFVLGGSAAMGTPEPGLGLPRVLQVVLEESFPGARFEVVNAAMAAINSHVVVDIARQSARRRPDLFVVYVGNNEVVGPYGPGTVFSGFAARRPWIRASLWLRGTRVGQLLTRAGGALAGRPEAAGEWRGMEMFLERTVAADDPRLAAVQSHLRANLEAVVAAAEGAGAPVVLSTVAVNLADAPPFVSLHPPGMDAAAEAAFDEALRRGDEELAAGRPAPALAAFDAAARLDGDHAGLLYRRGRALLASGRREEAAAALAAARDRDALRFRADGGVNRAIREAAEAARRRGAAVTLVDGEAALAAAAGGPPGDELFWEHVHLRFAGNYALARALLPAVAERLPPAVRAGRRPPPSAGRCAERLAITGRDHLRMASTIAEMTSRPPFTGWPDHPDRQAALRREIDALEAAVRREGAADLGRLAAAVAAAPEDLDLRQRYASALGEEGDPAGAAGQWRELLARVPGVPGWRTDLAYALADRGELAAAEEELRSLAAAEPALPVGVALATVLERGGRDEEAADLYSEVLERLPSHTVARLNLASLLARRGELDAAEDLLLPLAAERPSAAVYARLAEVAERRGDLEGAADLYRRAVELAPWQARSLNSLGYALARLGRGEEAADAYRRALAADPAYSLAWLNLADLLLAGGHPAVAAEAYQRGLALAPGNLQARYNLAGARLAAGDEEGAAAGFREVLAAEASHLGALNNLAWILATTRRPAIADRAEAVRLAERAAEATEGAPEVLETLAVAYAAAGRRAEARATAERAVVAARRAGAAELARRLEERLAEWAA